MFFAVLKIKQDLNKTKNDENFPFWSLLSPSIPTGHNFWFLFWERIVSRLTCSELMKVKWIQGGNVISISFTIQEPRTQRECRTQAKKKQKIGSDSIRVVFFIFSFPSSPPFSSFLFSSSSSSYSLRILHHYFLLPE